MKIYNVVKLDLKTKKREIIKTFKDESQAMSYVYVILTEQSLNDEMIEKYTNIPKYDYTIESEETKDD